MAISKKIRKRISQIAEGTPFSYEHLGLTQDEFSAAAKALSRMVSREEIKRLSTGVFYKPKKTIFGELKPRESEMMKVILFENNKRIGYVTGTSLYNKMGLTTQIPRVIQVASKKKRVSARIGGIITKPVKSYVNVSNENVFLLEILDAIKDFSQIPDLDKEMGIRLLLGKIEKLSAKDKSRLIKYALNYPPRTRALLGAILEQRIDTRKLSALKNSLNPLTSYELGIDKQMLATASQWNIR